MAEEKNSWFSNVFPVLGAFTQAAAVAGGGVGRQYKYNKKLAAYQHKKNMEILKYQLDYNTPKAQMGRFLEAGLNPNLVYGQGSPGNMESAPKYPDIQPPDVQGATARMGESLGDLGLKLGQLKLMKSQADLTDTKVDESTVKQDLMRSQKSLTDANPHLNKAYVDAMVTNLRATADLKKQESDFMQSTYRDADGHKWQRGFLKMQRELNLLEQKFNLGSADQALKAKVFESKEFQNQLQKIQVDWMKDGDITPQHIYQGILMILNKMM